MIPMAINLSMEFLIKEFHGKLKYQEVSTYDSYGYQVYGDVYNKNIKILEKGGQ